MTLVKYARRWAFGSNSDSLTPEEAGFFSSAQQLAGLGDGRRIVLRFSRVAPTGVREDAAQFDFEFVNFTAGAVDNTWVDADFVAIEGYVDTWWTAVKARCADKIILDEYRWYKFGPSLPVSAKGNEEPGPPVRVTDKNVAGSVTTFNPMPWQVAATVTFKTAIRKRWGRIYVAGFSSDQVDTYARIPSAMRTVLANATDALFASASAADYAPVVYSPTRRSAYGIEAVQVDDVWDVIRSRRSRETAARTIINT